MDRENTPEYLLEAIAQGFDVEVDVWVLDGALYLGHDRGKHLIDKQFLSEIASVSWFHCKNLEALEYFNSLGDSYRYFWHQEDDFTLTSNNYIWTYPGKAYGSRSIVVDLAESYSYSDGDVYAVCADYRY